MKLKVNRAEVEALVNALPAPDSKIQFVKDDGIYLMSFAQPKDARTVVYAKGYNPHKDGDVWEKCRRAVGGDDLGEDIGTKAEFLAILADSEGDLTVNVTTKTLSVSYAQKEKSFADLEVFQGAKTKMWRVVKDGKAKVLYPETFAAEKDARAFADALRRHVVAAGC